VYCKRASCPLFAGADPSVVSFSAVIDTPPGRLAITTDDYNLLAIDYVDKRTILQQPDNELARTVVEQLQCYFDDPSYTFHLPLKMAGTPYQIKVWQHLQRIKPGQTLTYGELATRIDSGARAVGNSCRRNPLPIIVPCHRVVSAHGIGGYAGHVSGRVLERKSWLLRHEQVAI
jgi:methylated-DNA-[protein]-cysteine S-methyltransferase